jgi:hypothetical protein
MLKATNPESLLVNRERSYQGLLKKYECLIEVEIVYSSHRWQGEITSKMMQSIAKLRAAVEELGGKIYVRY